MTKIEQIKAELNRRIELYGNPLGVADVRLQDERKGMLKALSDMLAFIDSIPAETVSPELDEAADSFAEEHFRREYFRVPRDGMRASFKAGAEWMAGQGNSIECDIEWYDGPFLGITEEQMLDATKDFKVGDKVIVQIRKK